MDIRGLFSGYDALFDAPMSEYTTLRVGGPADALVTPGSVDDLRSLIFLARENDIPLTIIGKGSNLLIRDGGIRGLVLRLCDTLCDIDVNPPSITAGCGAALSSVALAACKAGLSGLEFACGIPGTLGGALYMNAGAYGSDMAGVTVSVSGLLPDGSQFTLSGEELDFGYRHSRLMELNAIALSAQLRLIPGDSKAIAEAMREYAKKRRESQPLSYPSAGSAFKRPEGHFAGQLIQEAGLKGHTIGGAQVSRKHAGFIINLGSATSNDVEELINHIQNKVFAHSGVRLEPEIRLLGEK